MESFLLLLYYAGRRILELPSRRKTLTLQEAAEILGLSYYTVADMARAGKLPGAFQLQGQSKWLVSKPALDAFLADPAPK